MQLGLAASASASALDHNAAILTKTHAKGGTGARELLASHTALNSCPAKPLIVLYSSSLNTAWILLATWQRPFARPLQANNLCVTC